MEPVMAGRIAAWVGCAGEPGPAPEPFREKGVYLHPVGLSLTDIQEYYECFSNDALWAIFHDVIVPATFQRN
jgi:trehalose 6-phosphate synthase